MVLIRALLAAIALAAAPGCGESLFDANGGRSDGGTPDAVVMACPAPCIADAAADFTGAQGGRGGVWRYLDDRRDRTWAPMDDASGVPRSADPADEIAACAGAPGADACEELPGALLVSSASPLSIDPAIEYTSPEAQVIELSFTLHVPASGAAQTIRLYRNSREDALLTAEVQRGSTTSERIVVDALAGDRFLVALEPRGDAAGPVALHFFVSGRPERFPSACQLAVSFDSAVGSGVADRCRDSAVRHWYIAPSMPPAPPMTAEPAMPALGDAPFPELGASADVAAGYYYASDRALAPADELTVQLWLREESSLTEPAWVFSTLNLDAWRGLGINLYGSGSRRLEVVGFSGDSQPYTGQSVDYRADGSWRFLRVVAVRGTVSICLDGVRVGGFGIPTDRVGSMELPYVGRNGEWAPYGAYFDGRFDDLRVLSTALPCE